MACKGCSDRKQKFVGVRAFGESMATALKRAMTGQNVKASQIEIDKRQKLCETCLFKKDATCVVCNCFISFKTSLAHEKCPKGFW
jgi:hypothetical protein